ncbi:uncharacterized protein ASPGLDRAFT_127047 [Aspergillus glaucus CBS 516.65]|uniref:Clr5 domain-containing protein n=1 Tax=Aspergillus glaucus CBS 516.65 TaxID=1160497 RepID=A0A1L9VJK4_ASPGL|nr:hypothetical protein ASPGLDRAFT_127047 [Aspergillus glaucus CBS 516.65]OJJ84055.1 hypothetical protein ASPGLDRAFT_127047 [Aspergillus glaucus CBS 516.65]
MKNSIPSDVWEKKRALIAKLYKDEEWPLKQVIKQIRSEDFNPSETQLRSRLKKWRVTKPSRQTRKKSHDGQQEATGDDSDPDDASTKDRTSTASPTTQKSSQPAAKNPSMSKVDWHPVSLEEQDFSSAWIQGHPRHRDLSNSPSVMNQFPSVVPSTSSYDPSQPSTPVDGVLLNPSVTMAPPYSSPSYTMAPDVCLPESSAPTTSPASVPWSVPPWFSISLDPMSSQHHSVPFYTAAPPIGSPVAGSPDPSGRIYSPQPMQYHGMLPHGGMSEFMGDSKQWQRVMSLQCNSPEAMAGGINTGARGDARKYMERKASMPAKTSSHAYDMGNPSSQFFPGGQHPIMCAPLYPYPDQESLVHKPPGIGF